MTCLLIFAYGNSRTFPFDVDTFISHAYILTKNIYASIKNILFYFLKCETCCDWTWTNNGCMYRACPIIIYDMRSQLETYKKNATLYNFTQREIQNM